MKDRKIKFRYFTIMEWEKRAGLPPPGGIKRLAFYKSHITGDLSL